MRWLPAEDTSGGEKHTLRMFRFKYVAQATVGTVDLWCQFHLTREHFFLVSTLMWAIYSLVIKELTDAEQWREDARQLRKDIKAWRKNGGAYGPGY